MAKIKTTNYGTIHVNAQCEFCGWSADGSMTIKQIKAAAKKHTRETSHTTTIETGDCTEYRLLDRT